MTDKKLNIILSKYPNGLIFNFGEEDDKIIVVGYPVLRAFSCAPPICVEFSPVINVKSNKIFFSEAELNGKTTKSLPLFVDTERTQLETNFFSLIPDALKVRIKMFRDSHWEILKALVQCNGRLEQWIDSNPSLAYIAVNLLKLNSTYSLFDELTVIDDLTFTKRNEILQKGLFPASAKMINILKNTNPASLSVERLIRLRWLLSPQSKLDQKTFAVLNSFECLNDAFFLLIEKGDHLLRLCSAKLIVALIQSGHPEIHYKDLNKIWRIKKTLKTTVPEINSIPGIQKALLKLLEKEEEKNTFPLPPLHFEGDKNIVPLLSVIDQRAWSKRQNNCIDQHTVKVFLGLSYFYGVTNGDEEATLELIITKQRKVILGDLLGVNNKAVSVETKMLVESWYNQNTLKRKINPF